jgi:hypothetical protein
MPDCLWSSKACTKKLRHSYKMPFDEEESITFKELLARVHKDLPQA